MATTGEDRHPLSEHPVLARLLTDGGPDVRAYRGYVGTSEREGFLTIYPSLADLSKSFEICASDILHSEQIPEVFAPFGAIMLWVKADADVAARAVATSTGAATGGRADVAESRYGRLRVLRHAQAATPDTCTSNCECQSDCSPCISLCRWTCGTRYE